MKILSLVAPLILSFLKKKVKTEGYGASGLTSWLGSQKNDIMSSIPSEISSVMNFGSGMKTSHSTSSVADSNSGGNNWMPWLIGLLALLGLMWFGMKSCNTNKLKEEVAKKEAMIADAAKAEAARLDSIKNAAMEAMKSMYAGVDSTVRTKWMALGNMITLNFGDGASLSVPEKGVEGKLVTWIMDSTKLVDKTTWFDFDRILFETGSDKLNPASKEQVGNIAAILKAFPKVAAKIGGYTDNVGNAAANKKLSAARATTVMNELIALGIEAKRLAAEGYGPEHPVADNATAEGREMNRRVSLRVTAK
ncbi:MAG: OmpA family protein [Saprospiraceae bacterium]|nr:OmpA family protein [Saprospiraceae bacterium]